MSEKVIIDGVDVSDCRLRVYNSDLCNGFKMDNSGFHQGHCIQNPNCYYKQLQRAKEENKRLSNMKCPNCNEEYLSPIGADLFEENKELNHYLACMTEQRNKAKSENEQLKKEITTLECKLDAEKPFMVMPKPKQLAVPIDEVEKYIKALEEIREIAKIAFIVCDDECGNANKFAEIQNTINEILKEGKC